MDIYEAYDILKEEIENEINGSLYFDGVIKWEYDCLGCSFNDEIDDHLYDIYEIDKDIILEILNEDDFEFTEPEIDETFIMFYIE